jgi:hypothetical protein
LFSLCIKNLYIIIFYIRAPLTVSLFLLAKFKYLVLCKVEKFIILLTNPKKLAFSKSANHSLAH